LEDVDLEHINDILEGDLFRTLKRVRRSDRRVVIHLIDASEHGRMMTLILTTMLAKLELSELVDIHHKPIENVRRMSDVV